MFLDKQYDINGTTITNTDQESNKYTEAYYLVVSDIKDAKLFAFGMKNHFCGHFDGNGKTFSNITLRTDDNIKYNNQTLQPQNDIKAYAGLFSKVGCNGIVENINYTGNFTATNLAGNPDAAVICGYISGYYCEQVPSIINCNLTDVTCPNSKLTAGIVGVAYSGAVISNCTVNNLKMSNSSDQQPNGGICGTLGGGTIKNCKVSGFSANTENQGIGGICGKMEQGSSVLQCIVENSDMATTLQGNRQGTANAGGLIGVADMRGSVVEDCGVDGNNVLIIGNPDTDRGGLIGNITTSDENSVISNCFVQHATIKDRDNNTNKKDYDFALCGGNGAANVKIDNCFVYLPNNERASNERFIRNSESQENTYFSVEGGNTDTSTSNPAVKSFQDLANQIEEDENHFEVIRDEQGNAVKIILNYTGSKESFSKALYVNKWNFVSTVMEGAKIISLDNNAGVLGKPHDMEVLDFDYNNGDWSTLPLYTSDNMNRSEGYFVYPYAQSIGTEYKHDTIIGAVELNEAMTTWTQTGNYSSEVTAKEFKGKVQKTTDDGKVSNGYLYALANPFKENMSVSEFIKNNGDVQGSGVYIWNPTKGELGEWEYSTAYIPASDGFLVASNNNSFTPSFSSAKKKSVKASDSQTISFVAQTTDSKNFAFAQQNENSDNGFDKKDSYIIINNNTNAVPYFLIEEHTVIDNSFNTLPYIVPMNLHATRTTDVNLSVNNVPDDMDIYVIDSQTNKETLISDGTEFSFTANEGENPDRILIHFVSKKTALEDICKNDIKVYNNDRNIRIKGSNLQSVDVTDITGKVIYYKQISNDEYSFNLNTVSGAYIVKVRSLNGTTSQKIIIK